MAKKDSNIGELLEKVRILNDAAELSKKAGDDLKQQAADILI